MIITKEEILEDKEIIDPNNYMSILEYLNLTTSRFKMTLYTNWIES